MHLHTRVTHVTVVVLEKKAQTAELAFTLRHANDKGGKGRMTLRAASDKLWRIWVTSTCLSFSLSLYFVHYFVLYIICFGSFVVFLVVFFSLFHFFHLFFLLLLRMCSIAVLI